MKTAAILIGVLASASAFAPAIPATRQMTTALNDVPLANGAMSFNRVCREWRCKYDGDKATSESLEAVAKVVDDLLPEIKKASPDATVNRLVCGGCLDFKLMTTVPLDDFGPWEENGHPPEAEFLERIKAIPGISQVETQTITNMEI
mmetsp:Transcript_1175/g.1656  ORF Transcript_1175/g.1656 Transcript_1175/m.1656 type:complete len:147 (-) Transcript_1175:132-572(-)|eukprot:CAMPEP_0194037142 /NCGR_PEP_ID=MMETSP0009_2-20130614/9481_1 /TAXON_ID=210454 /ORGANISM="Grammatophora oceanica, Strain CCMP 410" /LENGTH=146 /DNA_ID=CAMNT_0038679181 /DNA_START=73 /DNA_END=516 /DNA_ORIENTATION=-